MSSFLPLYTSYSTEQVKVLHTGTRLVFHHKRIDTMYNHLIEPGDMGWIHGYEDGQVLVQFDRGPFIPLTIESDYFTTM
jgi:hypothetical protein